MLLYTHYSCFSFIVFPLKPCISPERPSSSLLPLFLLRDKPETLTQESYSQETIVLETGTSCYYSRLYELFEAVGGVYRRTPLTPDFKRRLHDVEKPAA